MKITYTQNALKTALSLVGRAVATRSTLPILGNVLLEAKGQEVRLSATDLAISINCWTWAEVEQEGGITLPAQLLSALVGKLTSDEVTLETNDRTHSATIVSGLFKAKLAGMAAEDFPQTLGELDAPAAQLDATVLLAMIRQVAFAATTDVGRPMLQNVRVMLGADGLGMAATDGYRLATREWTGGDAQELLISATALEELARILSGADVSQPVAVARDASRVTFAVAGRGNAWRAQLSEQLQTGKYPDYKSIIPKSHTTAVIVERAALLQSLALAALFADSKTRQVRLSTGEGCLCVAPRATAEDSSEDVLEAEIEGEPIEIMMDGTFLRDTLSALTGERVRMELNGARRPLVLRDVGEQDGTLHVIVPVHAR